VSNEEPKEAPKAIEKRAPTVPGTVDHLMEQVSYKKIQIERVLPSWMTVDRFLTQVRWALTHSKSASKLVQCSPASVVQAVLTAADLGLDPSGRLGSAYLVPYKSECQLIPGYRGLIDLAARSGMVRSVNAWVVHESDTFKPVNGKMPLHIPYLPKPGEPLSPGAPWAVWGRYQTRGGGSEAEIMSMPEVWSIRERSAGYKYAVQNGKADNPWISDFEEMAKKTVIRRMLKKAPLNPTGGLNVELERFAKALEQDDAVDGIADAEFTEEAAAPKTSRTEDLKGKL